MLVPEEDLKYGYWSLLRYEAEKLGVKVINKIEEYKGEEYLMLACTQLNNHTAVEQTKVVNKWCELFTSQQLSAKIIWLNSRASQKIIDAVCHQQNLEGLWIKWGVYPDISKLNKLQQLKYLHLGGGSSIEDISSVATLSCLKNFESSHLYKINNYSFLGKMKNITDLTIEGDPYSSMKHVVLDSLEFLEEMPQIQRLELCMTRIKDHSYLPITKLKNLRSLALPKDKDLEKDIKAFEKFKAIINA
jgi:hypothetical protein